MTPPRRPSMPLMVAVLAVVALGASASDDEEARWRRLEAMPPEHRLRLSGSLDRFDALPDEDREAVRRLDEAIAGRDPVVRARYQALLRRYHTWVTGLDDAKKAELAKSPSVAGRLKLVTAWRSEERKAKAGLPLVVPPGDLGAIPPFEMANALRVWIELDAKERTEVEAVTPLTKRLVELRRIGREKQIPMQRFPADEESALLDRLDANPVLKAAYPRAAEKAEAVFPIGKKKQDFGLNRVGRLHHLAESLYFLDHPPAPVDPANLARFEADLPPWLRSSIDPMPPEDARRRLAILYRQVYPPPKEMPAAKPSAPGPKAGPKARPSTPAPAGVAPF